MTGLTGMTAWTAGQVAGIVTQQGWELPVLTAADVHPLLPDQVVWDMWQVMTADGATVIRDGRSIWFFLAAPRVDDPDARHAVARIRLTSFGAGGWRDHGVAFADGFTPGDREWSGSSVLASDGTTLTMYFTASGRRGAPTMEQRLFESVGRFSTDGGVPQVGQWSEPIESAAAGGSWYLHANQGAPVAGRIKGFRDPGYFRDPVDGADYLLFVGSAAWVDEVHDGVVGLARRDGGDWRLLPPPITALGINSELERPHIIARDGRYYLFWTTQAKRFSDVARAGVTGLYAMVADTMAGPWRPVNATGLVVGNPRAEPFQAYCWWVTGELEVASFIDLWGLAGADPATLSVPASHHFGGSPAPFFRLAVDGDRVTIG